MRDRDLYNDTDTEVKRQIWKDNQSLFGDEVSPLLSQYIKEKENVLFDHNNLTNLFFTPSPKVSAKLFICTFYPPQINSNMFKDIWNFTTKGRKLTKKQNIKICNFRPSTEQIVKDNKGSDFNFTIIK